MSFICYIILSTPRDNTVEPKQWIRVKGIAPTIQATDSWKTHENHKVEIYQSKEV